MKLRCGTCIFLHKKNKNGTICEKLGKNKGNPACRSWEVNLEGLSMKAKEIISLLGSCSAKDIPVLKWILDKQQMLIEKKLPYRIGELVFFKKDQIYTITITNVTQKTITGRSDNASFTLLPENVFSSLEELKAFESKKAEKEAKALARR